eukprot:scaffold202275_cov36-Tisochrysis_lutea.AAC.1
MDLRKVSSKAVHPAPPAMSSTPPCCSRACPNVAMSQLTKTWCLAPLSGRTRDGPLVCSCRDRRFLLVELPCPWLTSEGPIC